MKKLLTLLMVILISAATAMGQGGQPWKGRPGMERIHAAKIAYITDKLHLSHEQATTFIPVYNEYEVEVRAVRQVYRQKYMDTHKEEADDMKVRQCIDDNLDYQQEVIGLKRKYNDRFLKTISEKQLAELSQAEREFKQILMQRMRQQPKYKW